ncbi:hypothetical protein ACQY0O_000740 [Thecaphora frezii]
MPSLAPPTASAEPAASLPYVAPSIVTILVLSSFLLLLPLLSYLFQRTVSAGIVGPLLLGAVYGEPLARLLPYDVQLSVLSLGYLGLMLLIVRGGIEARLDILSDPRNLAVVLLVGCTGVALPIGLSMALLPFAFGYARLEAFAMGAALASTSLGTTFAVINSFTATSVRSAAARDEVKMVAIDRQRRAEEQAEEQRAPSNHRDDGAAPSAAAIAEDDAGGRARALVDTRIGTILVGSALLDDIIGLVISSIVTSLGSRRDAVSASATASDLGSPSPLPGWTVARPIVSSFLLIAISIIVCRFVVRPVSVRWVFPYLATVDQRPRTIVARVYASLCAASAGGEAFGVATYVTTLLVAATACAYAVVSEEIGSSLLIGCFCAGAMMKYTVSLSRPAPASDPAPLPAASSARRLHLFKLFDPTYTLSHTPLAMVSDHVLVPFFFASIGSAIPVRRMFHPGTLWRGLAYASLMALAKLLAATWIGIAHLLERRFLPSPSPSAGRGIVVEDGDDDDKLPWSPALLLGLSLMARGEIGYLIINLARQAGLVDQQPFEVAVWAVTVNTIVAPILVGWVGGRSATTLLDPRRSSRWA